jgi:CDP-diacylglycerol--serine O-phosphatidyltransferase
MIKPKIENGAVAGHTRISMLMLLPNMITLMGMSLGLTAIRFAIEGRFTTAALMILLAMLADGLDGFVARRFRAISLMGAHLDSLSDFLCFGVAPAIVIYELHLTETSGYGWIFALLFAAATCLRLARFNVMQSEPQDDCRAKTHFVGLPAPSGAFLGLLPVFLTLAGVLESGAAPVLVSIWMTLLSILMISKLPTPSPRAIKVPRRLVPMIFFATVAVIGLGFTQPWYVFVSIDAVYFATIFYAIIRIRGRIFS